MSSLDDNINRHLTGDGTVEVAARREMGLPPSPLATHGNTTWMPMSCPDPSSGSCVGRTRDRLRGVGGYGPVPSIGRSIAECHGARLEASEDADGETASRVAFPADLTILGGRLR